jgi:hypothetical protein
MQGEGTYNKEKGGDRMRRGRKGKEVERVWKGRKGCVMVVEGWTPLNLHIYTSPLSCTYVFCSC